jgi:hypothetical protein
MHPKRLRGSKFEGPPDTSEMVVPSPWLECRRKRSLGRDDPRMFTTVDEVATEQGQVPLTMKIPSGNRAVFRGDHVGRGAILGLVIVLHDQQVSPANRS